MKRILSFIALALISNVLWAETLRVDYDGFTLWLDCESRSAIRFEYVVGPDTGNEKRRKYKYRLDPSLGDCQQLSTKSYWKETDQTYQRGHLVPFNHMDYSPESAFDANQMANILPQHKTLNTGAWKKTEEITECFREFESLRVIGGATWSKDSQHLEKHGIDIPEYFWKVLIINKSSIAWIIPNDDSATKEALDSFIVSLQDVFKATGFKFSEFLDQDSDAFPNAWDQKKCDRLGISNWRS